MFERIFKQAAQAGIKLPQGGAKLPLVPVGIAIGAVAAYQSMFNVESGSRAVKFNVFSGMSPVIYDEGTHFLVPWVERPTIFNVRQTAWQTTSQTGSRDLQTVALTVRVLSRPDPTHLVAIYRQFGLDYIDRIMPSICNETLRAVIAKFNASELLTKRAEVSGLICEHLTKRALDFGLIIEDVAITHLAFSKEYRDAVEAKQIAEQEAGRARFRTEQAIQEKLAMEVLAEGEAESARSVASWGLIGDAMKGYNGYLQQKRFEAAKEISVAISKAKANVIVSSDSLLQDSLALPSSM